MLRTEQARRRLFIAFFVLGVLFAVGIPLLLIVGPVLEWWLFDDLGQR